MIRKKSNMDPLDPAVARLAAETIRKAQAVGLVEAAPSFGELTYPALRSVVLQVREAGIGEHAAGEFVQANPSDTATLARDLREIGDLLEESPLPATEWPRLSTIFESDQLAQLVGISPSSLSRYERGERRTPDQVAARLHFVALIVGDLTGAYNEIGVRRWFDRKRSALGGRSPAQFLSGPWRPEDEDPQRVRDLARALVTSPGT
jgi:transcriptional regulator with XRE-family HTH domain